MWRIMVATAIAGVMVMMTSGCDATGARGPSGPPPVQLADSRWALVSLGGGVPETEQPITLELAADGRVSGFAGVNRYSGTCELRPGSRARGAVAFSELASTKMAGAEALMKQEAAFLELLRSSDAYVAEGGLLEFSAGGTPTVRFRQLSSR